MVRAAKETINNPVRNTLSRYVCPLSSIVIWIKKGCWRDKGSVAEPTPDEREAPAKPKKIRPHNVSVNLAMTPLLKFPRKLLHWITRPGLSVGLSVSSFRLASHNITRSTSSTHHFKKSDCELSSSLWKEHGAFSQDLDCRRLFFCSDDVLPLRAHALCRNSTRIALALMMYWNP